MELDIEYAIRVEKAIVKEEWEICINGVWYSKIYNCDSSDIGELHNIYENKLATIEDIQKWNSEEIHYNKILKYKNSNEEYLIKVK